MELRNQFLYSMIKQIIFITCFLFCFLLQANSFICRVSYVRNDSTKLSTSSILDFKEMPLSESFGAASGDYWFKVSIESLPTTAEEKLILQIPTHNANDIIVYEQIDGTLIPITNTKTTTGEKASVYSRFPTFILNVENEISPIYYLKVHFNKEANFPVRIYSVSEYYKQVYKHHIFTGAYYGFLLAILICNLFFYIKFQEKVYLYYLIFLATYTSAILFRDGTMNLLLPSEMFIDLEAISHLLTEITMFVFAFKFLDFDTYVPKFRKYAVTLAISMAIIELNYLVTNSFIFYVIADSIAMLSFLTTWIVCIVFMRKIKFARFYILGYSILIIFGFHFLFSYDFGLIPNNARTIFLKIASTTDMLIFTYAISYRLDILNKEHKRRIEELYSLLNKKVSTVDSFYELLEENTLTNKTLTIQEIKVLKCIYDGLSNRDIAEKLFVSNNTIKFHVRNIYKKLEVNNRKDAKNKLSLHKQNV